MLRQMMFDAKEGDKSFIAMMQDFVTQHRDHNATSESFQRVAEKLPSMDLTANGKLGLVLLGMAVRNCDSSVQIRLYGNSRV